MTTQAIALELASRDVLGKKVRQLRRAGIMPVHLYGPTVESRALQCETRTSTDVLAKAGATTPITVSIQGEEGTHLAFAREIQRHPLRDDILHVDLVAVEASRPVTAQVPVVLVGESPGARAAGGTVVQQLREVSIEALPLEMPNEFEVDLSVLAEEDSVFRAGELLLAAGVTLVTDAEEVVARIDLPRAVEEEEFPVEEEGAAEDEAAADTENAAQ